jgi:hypothetical protein
LGKCKEEKAKQYPIQSVHFEDYTLHVTSFKLYNISACTFRFLPVNWYEFIIATVMEKVKDPNIATLCRASARSKKHEISKSKSWDLKTTLYKHIFQLDNTINYTLGCLLVL